MVTSINSDVYGNFWGASGWMLYKRTGAGLSAPTGVSFRCERVIVIV